MKETIIKYDETWSLVIRTYKSKTSIVDVICSDCIRNKEKDIWQCFSPLKYGVIPKEVIKRQEELRALLRI